MAVLVTILGSYLMIVLDISIVITGLPRIQQSLGFSPAQLSWVHSAYTLAFGGLLLLGARAGDILGRRRVFILGLMVFTAASVVIGMAQSALWMLTARAVQGAGSALLAPSTLALLTTRFPHGPERTRAIGLYGATAGIGASIGLVAGGVLADMLSWRVGFFINLPVGLALMLAARRLFPESPRHHGRFDLIGAITSTLGMGSLVFALVHAAEAGWHSPLTLLPLLAAAVLIGLLLVNEWLVPQPIMPLWLFASRERTGALLARLLFLGAMVGFWFFTSQFLQGVLGLSAFATGCTFLATAIPQFIAALQVPRLTRKAGNGPLLVIGLAITLAGLGWLALTAQQMAGHMAMLAPMMLLGIGQGLTLSPLTVAGIANVPQDAAGAASGLVNMAHQLGGSLGLAVLVLVFSAVQDPSAPAPVLLAHRIAAVFASGAGMLAETAAIVGGLILPGGRRPPSTS